MSEPAESRHLPDPDRLSILAATILLAYALSSFIDMPGRELSLQLPGVYLEVQFNTRTFVAVLVAGLTATGADWLLRDHPALGNKSTIQHWMLPALTALVIGLPLSQMPIGPLWWVGFAIAGGVMMLVLLAEYIVVDPTDSRQAPATVLLTAVSFALFLALAVTLRSAGFRLFLVLPSLTIAAGLVSLRTMHLRLHGKWAFLHAGIIALIISQLAAALHYWPLTPVTYGLLLLGPAYALTSLFASLLEDVPFRQAITEPVIVLVIVWGVAYWIR